MLYVIEYQVDLIDEPKYVGPFQSWEIETAADQWVYVVARALSRRHDPNLYGFVTTDHLDAARQRMTVMEIDPSKLPKHLQPPTDRVIH